MAVAFRLLARRARSEAEIRSALNTQGFSQSVVRRALGRLRELGYISDLKLAAEWAERLQQRGFGSYRIRDQLQKLGVDDGLAARVMPAAREERVLARKLMEERFGNDATADPRRRYQAYRFLAGRGFPEEILQSLFDPWSI